jgi:hypothetical protein
MTAAVFRPVAVLLAVTLSVVCALDRGRLVGTARAQARPDTTSPALELDRERPALREHVGLLLRQFDAMVTQLQTAVSDNPDDLELRSRLANARKNRDELRAMLATIDQGPPAAPVTKP